MAITNVLLLSQIAGYIIGLILSLCMVVPMSMHVNEFGGHCLLFSAGEWQEADGQLLVAWASRAYCDYVIAVGALSFLFCLVMIIRLSFHLYSGVEISFLWSFGEAAACLCACALSVCAALVVTLGFIQWCDNIVQRFPSCEAGAGQNIDHKDNISTSGFYIELGTVQFGTWASFALWVGVAVMSALRACRLHQAENIRVSMYRERRRLVNEPSDRADPTDAADPGRSTPPHSQHEQH